MTSYCIRDLYVYPLKSGAGIRLDAVTLDGMGFSGDRRWMVVDEAGTFLSQRTLPRMALVRPAGTGSPLVLDAPGMPPLSIAIPAAGSRVEVTVWNDRCEAIECSPDASAWMRSFLGVACRLVYSPDDMDRRVDPTYAQAGDSVGFADGFPLLLIGQASLDDLNTRLVANRQMTVPMERFRPNVVVQGGAPYSEDEWEHLTVGPATVRLDVVKPCARCATVVVDQSTGARGHEPLKTLAEYRRRNGSVYFGQNVIHRSGGTIKVGDPVEVHRRSRVVSKDQA